jgi:AraC family transcriptional regulator
MTHIRAATAGTSGASPRRTHFAVRTGAIALAKVGLTPPPGPSVVLEVRLPKRVGRGCASRHEPLPMMAHPASLLALVAAIQSDIRPDDEPMDLLVPRGAFDQLADFLGARRITTLAAGPRRAMEDEILRNLSACLSLTVHGDARSDDGLVEELSLTILLHIAQQYGQMELKTRTAPGGLSPWQLRLARRRLVEHFDGIISLKSLAAECGLSVSHFARAFSTSTGLPPHRWLMHRRIDIAKDMVMQGDLPLSHVAQACGFADQSHFTRTFASIVGFPPARWRLMQKHSPSPSMEFAS